MESGVTLPWVLYSKQINRIARAELCLNLQKEVSVQLIKETLCGNSFFLFLL